jgi:hypothetical protein
MSSLNGLCSAATQSAVFHSLLGSLRLYLVDGHRGSRAAAYRALRYVAVNTSILPLFKQYRIYVLIARCAPAFFFT